MLNPQAAVSDLGSLSHMPTMGHGGAKEAGEGAPGLFFGRWGSWRGKYSKQRKTWHDKWPLQSARWIRCNNLIISQATESHWASSAIFFDIWPCLLVIFWLGDLKKKWKFTAKKRALSSVLCFPYHNGMYYGNCGYTFIWSVLMHNTFLLQILVKRGVWANARLGWRRGAWSWKRFLMEHQVQLRISLLGFETASLETSKVLITES